MLLWEKELDRLADLEEMAGIAQELALSYANPEFLRRNSSLFTTNLGILPVASGGILILLNQFEN
jgi:hypothetical protein